MPPLPAQPHQQEHRATLRQEHRSQLRGLLLLAAVTLAFILWRAAPLHLFHANWWRL